MKYAIHPEAQAEYEDHLLYFAAHGLTFTTLEDFRSEIETAFEEIAANPLTYGLVRKAGKQRRYGPTKKFRFIVYYVVKNDGITPYVLAIVHPSRKPNYWSYRA